MDERQSFFEDDDDTLLFEKLQEHVLEKYPNPERIGCIDHSTLKTWVYFIPKSWIFPESRKYLHAILKCAECTQEDLRSNFAGSGTSNRSVQTLEFQLAAVPSIELAMGGIRVGHSLLPGCTALV